MTGNPGVRLLLAHVTINVLQGVVSQWVEMYGDMRTCKEKPTGIEEYMVDNAPRFATCITRAGPWCKCTCALKKLGFINETWYMDMEYTRKVYVRTTKINNPTRDLIFQDFEKCVGTESFDLKGSCPNMRKSFYCLYNKYIWRCRIQKARKKLGKPESDILDDAIDGVAVLGHSAASRWDGSGDPMRKPR